MFNNLTDEQVASLQDFIDNHGQCQVEYKTPTINGQKYIILRCAYHARLCDIPASHELLALLTKIVSH